MLIGVHLWFLLGCTDVVWFDLAQLLQQRPGFVIGSFVSVIGRAVAGGERAGLLGVVARSSQFIAGHGEAGEFQMGVSALQHVTAALGDQPRLFGQTLGFFALADGGAEPRQVNQDVSFVFHRVDAAAAFQRLVQVALGLVQLTGDAVRRAQQPVSADVLALDWKFGACPLVRQFQRAARRGASIADCGLQIEH